KRTCECRSPSHDLHGCRFSPPLDARVTDARHQNEYSKPITGVTPALSPCLLYGTSTCAEIRSRPVGFNLAPNAANPCESDPLVGDTVCSLVEVIGAVGPC